MNLLSIIIPVFRNKGSLTQTYNQLKQCLVKFEGLDFEIIFVNDGSDDGSLDELRSIRQTESNVRVISFSRNFGQVAAVVAGFRAAKGNAALNISADLQEPVSLIENLIKEWLAGNSIVIGHRISRDDTLIARKTSAFFYRLMNLSNAKIPVGGFDCVLLDRKPLQELNKINERNRFFQGDILWLGYKTIYIPYERLKREVGKSQWSFSKKLKYFVDGLLNTSYMPIRLMSMLGFLVSLLGFIYALVVVYGRMMNQTPFKGYAPIVILILIIGGMVMLMLGVIGEYVWRIYDETRKRPFYIIEEDSDKDEAQ